jgi:dihydrofolate reductase
MPNALPVFKRFNEKSRDRSAAMRRLVVSAFVSLDGVMQAPGGPQEDPSNGFVLGGWSFSFWDEVMGQTMSGFDGKDRELVLGRKTYEIFEAHWPYQPIDDPTAQALNSARKHVASRTLTSLAWSNSTLLGQDVIAAVTVLKTQPGFDLQVIGSASLTQTLHVASLIDEYNVWTFPVVLGHGKRLFEASAKPQALRIVKTLVSTTGVVMTTYVRAGDIAIGSFEQADPSAKEVARRKTFASDSH